MYIDNSARKVRTFQRPQIPKKTAGLPNPHHLLEDLLSRPAVRRLLGWITVPGQDGKCFFERLCENYDRDWRLATWLIDSLWIKRAGVDKEHMKLKLFHHRPTVRALALTGRSIARYGLTTPQRFAAPLFVVWNFTQACNLSCEHCYQNARHKPDPDELTLEEKIYLVDQLAENFVPFLAIAGGEPLVHKDLFPVLEHAHRRGLHLTLATNGTLLKPETAARLKEAGVKYVEVSLDSLDPAQHDAFRGQKGAWARAVQGIRNSVAAGIRTGMAACFTRHTADTADELVRFAIGLGCQTFSHFNFIPVGRGREILDADLTPGQREILMGRLTRHLQEGRINVISTAPQFGRACVIYGWQDGVFATGHAGRGEGRKTMVLSRYIGGCGAGRCYCSVQPNGTVTPCVYMSSEKVANIRQAPLADIWNSSLFRLLADREDRGDHCGVCDYRNYCGGCRARAAAYTGDLTAGDPGCSFNYHLWNEISQTARGASAGPEEAAFHVHAGDNGRAVSPAVRELTGGRR